MLGPFHGSGGGSGGVSAGSAFLRVVITARPGGEGGTAPETGTGRASQVGQVDSPPKNPERRAWLCLGPVPAPFPGLPELLSSWPSGSPEVSTLSRTTARAVALRAATDRPLPSFCCRLHPAPATDYCSHQGPASPPLGTDLPSHHLVSGPRSTWGAGTAARVLLLGLDREAPSPRAQAIACPAGPLQPRPRARQPAAWTHRLAPAPLTPGADPGAPHRRGDSAGAARAPCAPRPAPAPSCPARAHWACSEPGHAPGSPRPVRTLPASGPGRAALRAAMERIEGVAVGRCAASLYLRPFTLHYRQVSPPRPRAPSAAPPAARAPRSPAHSLGLRPRPRPLVELTSSACGSGASPVPRPGERPNRDTSGDYPSLRGGFAGPRHFLQWDVWGVPGVRESFLEVGVFILGSGGRLVA